MLDVLNQLSIVEVQTGSKSIEALSRASIFKRSSTLSANALVSGQLK